MIQVLEHHGVRDFTVQPSLNTSLLEGRKLVLLNQFVRQLPATAWLIFADVDEFFAYPCDVLSYLRVRSTLKDDASVGRSKDRLEIQRRAACALMHDRLAEDGSLPAVKRSPSLTTQFPVCTKMRALRGAPITGNTLKISLLAARIAGGVPEYLNAHRVQVPISAIDALGASRPEFVNIGGTPQTENNCYFTGRFSHYSMVYEAQELAWRKISDREQVAWQNRNRNLPSHSSLRCTNPHHDSACPCPTAADLRAHRVAGCALQRPWRPWQRAWQRAWQRGAIHAQTGTSRLHAFAGCQDVPQAEPKCAEAHACESAALRYGL